MVARDQSDHIWDSSGQINSTGSSNAYVIAIAEPVAGYFQGMPPIRFKANFGNTGPATANIVTPNAPSGLGAVTMKKFGGATDLVTGDIVSGGVYTLIHDGTNFQVLELHTGVLVTGNIADDAITYAKIQNVSATSRILGRKTSGAGDVEECTLSEVLDFIGSAAQGDILYRGASSWERLGAGTSGQFLQTQGAAANPQWAAAGGMVLLTSGTVSSAATLDIVLTNFTGYRAIKILLSSFIPATDDVELWMRFSTDGGSNYDATGYSYTNTMTRDAGGALVVNNVASGSANQIAVARSATAGESVSNVSTESGAHADIIISDPETAAQTAAFWSSTWFGATVTDTFNARGSGRREATQNTDAVRFLFESGNIASGKYAVYGLL